MLSRAVSLVTDVHGWSLFIRIVTVAFVIMAIARLVPVRVPGRPRRVVSVPRWLVASWRSVSC
jgi:hypothetical protein